MTDRQDTAKSYDEVADEYVAHIHGELRDKPLDRELLEDVRELGLALPGVEDGVSYGETLVVRIGFEDRQRMLETDPQVFCVTDHYLNYPAMLVRLDKVRRDVLRRLLEGAWRRMAPKRLVAERAEALPKTPRRR